MPTYHLDILVDGKDRGGSGLLRGVGGLLNSLGKTALLAATGGILALSTAFGASIAKGSEFSSVMSAVRADLGPTAAEFEGLSAKALQLGKDTSFGAGDAAAAIDELARNGLNATQILSGAADATVHLAEATGLKGREGLATAATVATDAMANFGLTAEDMTRAINGISGVAVVSKFDINDYALAMAQAGGVAGSVGVEFEDFNTAIAGISSLFSSGSDAGTSYKTMLQRLVPVSGPAAEAMTKLGIITKEAGNRFFDAKGNLKSMAEISGVLQVALRGLSESDAIDLFTTAFGTDAQRAAFGLAKLGTAGFNQLAASISKVDAAAQAATRLDNLAGDMEQLRGSLETAGIEMETAFEPMLRRLVQTATAFVNTNLIGRDWSPLISGLTGAANAVTGFIGAVQTAGGPVAYLQGQFSELRDAAVQWVTDAIPQARAGLTQYAEETRAWALASLPGWIDSLKGWAAAAGRWAIDAVPGLLVHLLELRNQAVGWALGQVPHLIDAIRPWSIAFLQWVVDAAPGMLGEFGRLTGQLLDTIGLSLPGIVSALAGWGAELVNWVIVAAPRLWPELLNLAGQLAGWIAERVPVIASQLGAWAIAFVGWVGETTPKLIVAAGGMLGTLLYWLYDNRGAILTTLGTWAQQLDIWVKTQAGPALLAALTGLATSLWAEIARLGDQARSEGTIGRALIDGIRAGIAQVWGDLVADLQQRLGTLANIGLRITPVGGLMNSAGVPGFASGVTNFRGGLALVGERGPELLNLPGGSDVLPRGFAGGGGSTTISVGQIVVQEAQNARETAQAVREELIRLGKRNSGNVFGGFA